MSSDTATYEQAVAGTPPRPRIHLAYIDGLRAVAALYVLMHHVVLLSLFRARPTRHSVSATALAPGPFASGTPAWFAISPFFWGHFAVTVFLAISGFCLMLPVVQSGYRLRGGAGYFIKRRFLRIVPTYWLAFLISLGIMLILGRHATGMPYEQFLAHGKELRNTTVAHLLLIHNLWGGAEKINGPLWSIAVEWQIYFTLPVLVALCSRLKPVAASALAAIVGFTIFALLHHSKVERLHLEYYGVFALGCLSAVIVFDPSKPCQRLRAWPWQAAFWLLFAATMGVCYRFGLNWVTDRQAMLDLPVGLGAMCLLIACAVSKDAPLTKALSWKPLAGIGLFAYSIYLLHEPLLQVIWRYGLYPLHLSPVSTYFALVLIGLVVITAVSYGFYRLVEKPFADMRPRPSP